MRNRRRELPLSTAAGIIGPEYLRLSTLAMSINEFDVFRVSQLPNKILIGQIFQIAFPVFEKNLK